MQEGPVAPPAAPEEPEEIISEHTPTLGKLFGELGVSLVVSTYQAGKLITVRSDGEVLQTHFNDLDKPMGIAVDAGKMAVGVTGEILFYSDVKENCRKLDPPGRYDACYMQRHSHMTGDIDIHEMAFGTDGQPWFINTRFSTLCTLSGLNSFTPVWRPKFISAYAPEDRCHLNGLGMLNGKPRYVTALGESDKPAGWRDRKADGGVLFDLATGRTLCRGLSMPHSPRWYGNQLWVCESGKGTLSKVDYASGEVTPFFQFPGFTRGLDFFGPLAFVGLSQIRETATFSGIPIVEKAKERNCGIWIINLASGNLVGTLRFKQGVREIFAVQVLHGARYPAVLDRKEPLALQSYFLPSGVIQNVVETPVVKQAYAGSEGDARAQHVKPVTAVVTKDAPYGSS